MNENINKEKVNDLLIILTNKIFKIRLINNDILSFTCELVNNHPKLEISKDNIIKFFNKSFSNPEEFENEDFGVIKSLDDIRAFVKIKEYLVITNYNRYSCDKSQSFKYSLDLNKKEFNIFFMTIKELCIVDKNKMENILNKMNISEDEFKYLLNYYSN